MDRNNLHFMPRVNALTCRLSTVVLEVLEDQGESISLILPVDQSEMNLANRVGYGIATWFSNRACDHLEVTIFAEGFV